MYNLDAQDRLRLIMRIEKEKRFQRQKLPKVYRLNGAVYIGNVSFMKDHCSFVGVDTVGYIMPQERSYDIDTVMDFKIVEVLCAR